MSLNTRLSIFAVLGLALCACAADPRSPSCERSTASSPALGETFMLGYQQSVIVKAEGLKLSFSKLVSDSRCPSGVQCIWEGNAELKILARKAAGPAEALSLNTSSRFATQTPYQGYRVELVGLKPAPESEHPNKAADHCAVLRVTKND